MRSRQARRGAGFRAGGHPHPARRVRPSHGLTPGELKVLRQVAAGETNRAIGRELFISEKTVDRQVSNTFTKLHVSSRAPGTAYAYENQLVWRLPENDRW